MQCRFIKYRDWKQTKLIILVNKTKNKWKQTRTQNVADTQDFRKETRDTQDFRKQTRTQNVPIHTINNADVM